MPPSVSAYSNKIVTNFAKVNIYRVSSFARHVFFSVLVLSLNLFDRWIWRLMNYCYTFRVNISINHSIRQNTSRFAENGFDKVVRAKKQKPLLRKQIHWKERKKMISCFNWLFIAVEVILSRFHLFASSFHTHETAPLNSAANSLFCNW